MCMKKLFSITLVGSSLFLGAHPAKADWDTWGAKKGTEVEAVGMQGTLDDGSGNPSSDYYPPRISQVTEIYKFNSETGAATLINTYQHCNAEQAVSESWRCSSFSDDDSSYDSRAGKLIFKSNNGSKKITYDINNNTWDESTYSNPKDSYQHYFNRSLITTDPITGITKIGENSLNFKETPNMLDVWGTNTQSKKVPINMTEGLLIKGRDVEQSINNVGALSAALTGLPTIPTNSSLACGLGTGTHGGDFAFSGGCASRVNKKLSINYAASMTMPSQDYAGDFEDKFSARAGFVWQLGNSNKPTKISMNQKEEIDLKISKLENDNELLKTDNKELKAKNNEIISKNEKLLERLEKLEKIAFDLQKNIDFRLSKAISE